MIATATAAVLAHNLIVYRELLSVALERLHATQRQLAARDETVTLLRDDLRRYTRERAQG